MLKEKFDLIQRKLLLEIKNLYKDRLVSVVIYGSVARGVQNFESDIDILIIAKDMPAGRMKRVREFEIVENEVENLIESCRKDGINTYISPILKSPAEAESGSPLFLDMVDDGKILFDDNGFFADILGKLRDKLTELGSRRIWNGSSWYWDLKPDYQPGEIFEL